MDKSLFLSVFDEPRHFGLAGYDDRLVNTELASHVRFVLVDVIAVTQFSNERILAWTLRRNSWMYSSNQWRSDLNGIRFVKSDQDELCEAMTSALFEVRNSDYVSRTVEFPIRESHLDASDSIYKIEGVNFYEYGPTHMFCWWNHSMFGYLETHWES